MKEELETTYKNIITLINNSEAEIECMVRQKLTMCSGFSFYCPSSEFAELIIAQKKLQEAEVLIRNILNNIRKSDFKNKKEMYRKMLDDVNLLRERLIEIQNMELRGRKE